MIPADIKEMAKHDEVVAELLAAGGPFMYADYQRIRNGQLGEVIHTLVRRARIGALLFSVFMVLYIGLVVWGVVLDYTSLWSFDGVLRIVSVPIYGTMAVIAYRRKQAALAVARRIDAGEFSTD